MGTLSTIVTEIEHVLNEVDEAQLDTFADQLLAAPRVFVTGEGRSGLMARAFAMRLMHLGLAVYVIGETTTPAIQGADALVAVSGSGTTEGTVHTVQQAKALGSLFDQCCHIALDAVCLHIAERKNISNDAARQLHTNVE
jgi:6-phospho-3-hexuloisomerase